MTLLDVFSGNRYTYTEAQFTSMLSTFGGMGVAVGPKVVAATPYPVVTSLSPAAGPVGGGQTVRVVGTGFTPSMTVAMDNTRDGYGNHRHGIHLHDTARSRRVRTVECDDRRRDESAQCGRGLLYTGLSNTLP